MIPAPCLIKHTITLAEQGRKIATQAMTKTHRFILSFKQGFIRKTVFEYLQFAIDTTFTQKQFYFMHEKQYQSIFG